jgi:RNA recognition motif-containing protein
MDHLTPFQGDRSRYTNHFNNSNVPRDNKRPTTNELYIGQIPNDVDGISLRMFFCQFGEIERVFEGGRRQSGGMKWAFVSYIHPEDAAKYSPSRYIIINVSTVSCNKREELDLQGQSCFIPLIGYLISSNIRPRDRSPSTMERQRERQSPPRQLNRDRSNTSQMIRPQARSSNPSRGFPPRPPDSAGNPPWNPYPLLSKTLTVANLPPEFTPKDLYELFSDFGKADVAFVYALPDSKGRRVGEVVMATYLFAQKVIPLKSFLMTGSREYGWSIY